MPELQNLERLKSEIMHLADEPAILEKRGLKPPVISPPEQEEDHELSQLLEDFGEEFGEEAGDEESGFEKLEEEAAAEEEAQETGPAEETAPADEAAPEAPEEIGGEEEAAAVEEAAVEEEAAEEFEEGALEELLEEEPGPEEPFEEFSFEEGIEEGIEEAGPEETAGEPAPEEETAEALEEEAAAEEGPSEEEDFSLPEMFELDEDIFGEEELPDFSGAEEGEEVGEEEAEEEEELALPEFGEEEEVSIPEFEESEFEEPEIQEEEAEEIELESLDETVEEVPEISGEEDFGEEAPVEEEAGETEAPEEFEMPEEFEGAEVPDELPAEGLEELELPEEEFEEGEFEIDEFNLGDLGEEFGVLEEGEQEVIAAPEETGVPELEEEEAAVELTDEQFKAMAETLLTLPRNLKLIVEEQIGERGLSGKPLRNLIDALVQRKSPKEIAQIASRITGKRIRIPSQYEKRTGAAFEAEKESFAYTFRYRIFPMLRTIVLTAAVIALFIFLGVRFVYRPLYALHLYNQGYDQLEEREYLSANDYFQRGLDQMVMRKQFFRYAEGYEQQRQWTLAEEKYEQLLQRFPLDKEGTLAYAELELEKLSNYGKAADLLQSFLNEEPRDYEASLLLGDTYLEWGDEDPEKYEQARYMYAVLMENYGVSDLLLFRMLRYFVRTDKQDEVLNLKNYYEERPEVEVDPQAFTELGAYLIDKNRLEDVRRILLRSKAVDETLPETHYHLGRYFHLIEEQYEEEKALGYTLSLLENISPLTEKRIQMKVDTHRRYGELLYSQQKYLDARSHYTRGINLYEDSLDRKLIEASPELGKIYADLADIHYYQSGEYDEARRLYVEAEKNGYDSPDMKYKQGFISYREGEYRLALLDFQRSAGAFSTNRNLMYATANTLFRRGNYQSSLGYYLHLNELLKQKMDRELPLLIDERRDHKALVENLMRTSNNLGVAYFNLYRKTGLSEHYSKAMVQFADSSNYYDTLTRNPDTMERTGLSNLAFVNQRNLLFPQRDYELQIYADIPMDMDKLEL